MENKNTTLSGQFQKLNRKIVERVKIGIISTSNTQIQHCSLSCFGTGT